VIHPVDYGDVRYFRMARTYWGRAFYWTGVYYLDGLLIDSGPPNLARSIAQLIRELGVRDAVTTHHHEDHSGNNRLLQDSFGILPLAHAASLPLLARPDVTPLAYRRAIWGVPRSSEARLVGSSIETPRFRFEVIETPGHALDHIALFESSRGWMFTGDLYLAPRLKVLRADEDVHALIGSLRRLAAFDPEVIFCQHRGRVEKGGAALRQKLDFLTELGERVRSLHQRGLPEAEIAKRLGGSDFFWRLGTAGDFSKQNFVRSFLRGGAVPPLHGSAIL